MLLALDKLPPSLIKRCDLIQALFVVNFVLLLNLSKVLLGLGRFLGYQYGLESYTILLCHFVLQILDSLILFFKCLVNLIRGTVVR